MSQHYNAFISYRHGPLDSKIAARVQKQLEHFHIPKAIAKATGIRKIDRVFRDKDELGMVGELNENIEQALVNADYLIVICSPATKGSIWVDKEIELFLKTHSPNRVLAVLADGEPQDVVPERLLYREVEMEDDDGVLHTIKVPREALLCDYRVPPAKARKEELPRLAAALLGCTYDDLRRRQRQYRNRRIAAAGVAAGVAMTGLAAYYAWSAKQIQENYWNSLYNQSTYLASESQKMLESGDRLTAMLLAIHALPEKEGDRPVVPAAVDALKEAANAYQVPGHDMLLLDRAFQMPGRLDDWFCDWERGYLIAQTDSNKVTIWDLNTGELLFTDTLEDGIETMFLTEAGNLVVVASDDIRCYDGTKFTLLWKTDVMELVFSGFSCGKYVVLGENQGEDREVYLLDAATGDVIRSVAVTGPEETEEMSNLVYPSAVSEDGRYVAVEISVGYDEKDYVMIWDLETDAQAYAETEAWYLHKMCFLPDGGLVAAGVQDESSLTYTTRDTVYHFLLETPEYVQCVETDGTVRWKTAVVYPQQYQGVYLDTLTYEEKPAVLCAVGNIAQVLDAATGEVLLEVDFPEPIIHIRANEERMQCVLEDGQLGTYVFKTAYKVTQEAMVEATDGCDRQRGGDICISKDDRILLYRWDQYDQSWQEIEGVFDWPSGCGTKQGFLMKDKEVYSFYSAKDGKCLWTKDLSGDHYWSLLGESASGDEILFYEASDDILMKISTADGATQIEKLPYPIDSDLALVNDGVCYYTWDTGELVMFRDGRITTVPVPDGVRIATAEELEDGTIHVNVESPGRYIVKIFPNPAGTEFLMEEHKTEENEYVLLTEKGELLPVEKPKSKDFLWQPDGSGFVVKGETELFLCDRQMAVLTQIPCEGMSVEDMHFYEDQLLVLYSVGKLYRYDRLTGRLLGTSEVPIGLLGDCCWEDSVPGELAILKGDDLYLLETENWQLQAHIQNCLAYVSAERTIFARGYGEKASEYTMGMFRLKDYGELMEMAREQLDGLELTPEQKAAYGIE